MDFGAGLRPEHGSWPWAGPLARAGLVLGKGGRGSRISPGMSSEHAAVPAETLASLLNKPSRATLSLF